MPDAKPFAFVLMPFSSDFDDIYRFGIKQTAEACGVVTERVDEQHFSGSMMERIYGQIENSDFIIADMTGQNANVFYEVGYAHALKKLCIHLTQSSSEIPFDLKHHQHIPYNGKIDILRQKLAPKIQWAVDEIAKRKDETLSINLIVGSGNLESTEYSRIGSCNIGLVFKNRTSNRSPEIEVIYLYDSKEWRVDYNGDACHYDFIENGRGTLKRFRLNPPHNRLPADDFMELKTIWSREFWNMLQNSDQQPESEYSISGEIRVEVILNGNKIEHKELVEVLFDEIPF